MGWRTNLAAALAMLPGPALAWTGTIDWPTFYRAGPDKRYAVLDELQRGHTLEVLSCGGDWCRVQNGRSIGFVEQGALVPPSPPPPRAAAPGPCFESRSAGYDQGGVFRYCQQSGG